MRFSSVCQKLPQINIETLIVKDLSKWELVIQLWISKASQSRKFSSINYFKSFFFNVDFDTKSSLELIYLILDYSLGHKKFYRHFICILLPFICYSRAILHSFTRVFVPCRPSFIENWILILFFLLTSQSSDECCRFC